MSLYERCHAIGNDACLRILEENGINHGAVTPSVELAEAIEFGDVDEIELLIEEEGI